MNELYALDPEACSNAFELRYLLEKFGPFTGRYGVQYPASWEQEVLRATATWSELDRMRAKEALHQARQRYAVLREKLEYVQSRDWFENLEVIRRKGVALSGAVVRRPPPTETKDIHTVDSLDLPPTTDERIRGTKDEYLRVSSALIRISPELALIDPYFTPSRRDHGSVLDAYLRAATSGPCKAVYIWAKPQEGHSEQDVARALRAVCRGSGFRGAVTLRLVDDSLSDEYLHARYLLSIRGGIRFDVGFQETRRQREVDVSVVGKAVHDKLCRRFFEGEHDFRIHTEVTA